MLRLVRHFFLFFSSSLCFPDVIKTLKKNLNASRPSEHLLLFNLRVSSLTESDLYKDDSDFHKV